MALTYPKAGSASEAIDEQGAALFNKCLAFKSGSGISSLLINRTIEDAGGMPLVELDRTKATLMYTVTPENAARLVPLLAIDCSFEKWDVRDTKANTLVEAEAAASSAQIVLTENLYAAAYGPQSPAGRPLYSTGVSTDAVKSFRAKAYGIKGAVLAATGVKDHASFCTEVAELLSDSPAGSAAAAPAMTYLGGESRVAAPASGLAHVALAFKSPESSAVTAIVKQLLSIAGAEAGVSGFTAAGMVGVYAGGEAAGLVDSMCSALTASVSADAIKRAKNLAKAEALFAIDGGSKALVSAMTAAVLESGSFTGPADVAKAFDAVTQAQVKEALTTMLKSNPALAAVGDIAAVPYHATVASRFS